MTLLASVALAAPPPPTEAVAEMASILAAIAGPAPVQVLGEPLAAFVPELAVASGPEEELGRLLHAPPVRQCYATALGRQPAWLVIAAIALDVAPSGEITARVYGSRARPGLEAGWTSDRAFEACVASALSAAKTTPRDAPEHWTLEATFRPAFESTSAPEGNVMGFGSP